MMRDTTACEEAIRPFLDAFLAVLKEAAKWEMVVLGLAILAVLLMVHVRNYVCVLVSGIDYVQIQL